ncbi:hypothetical protein WKH57_14305 [Niallia taxi]|uniref:hypothetical protein n=1 Tax=Niallia taxi TaxID=2499688 RepID=UPI00316CD8B6
MDKKYFCKECNHCVSKEEYYHQGKVCKKCRNEKKNEKISNLAGVDFAEYLLHKSCIRVLERVRSNKKEAYKGVKCDWDKPLKMKEDLMTNDVFWGRWIEQSRIYEKSGRLLNVRPTIDRIESNVENGGHYSWGNLQVLSYSENTYKAQAVKCKVVFIRGIEVVCITEYESIINVMKELGISGYNVISLLKDSGKIQKLNDNYSVLIQTLDGTLKKHDSPLYNGVITKQKIIVDYETGKEYIVGSNQYSFQSYGIWFGEDQVWA